MSQETAHSLIRQFNANSALVFALKTTFGIIFLLATILVLMTLFPREPDYYAKYPDGHLQQIPTLMQPNVSPSTVLRWSEESLMQAYTFDFVNYRSQLRADKILFTNEGWDAFLAALDNSGYLKNIWKLKVRVSAVIFGPSVIVKSGVLDGIYTWRVQIPVLITYQSASDSRTQKEVVTLLVRRISTLSSYRGIGISRFDVDTGFFS